MGAILPYQAVPWSRMDGVAESASTAARPTVAVTSALGALIGRRRDGTPPWTFPGGKIEPGESPEDARG